MGFFDSLTQGVKTVQKKIKTVQTQRAKAGIKASAQARDIRNRSLPLIRAMADKYSATVEALDTDAYVSKGENGIHIRYGTSKTDMQAKMDRVFSPAGKSAVKSKIVHGVKKAVRGAKKAKKDLGEIRKELKAGLGTNKNSLYPPIKFY